jgi:hypothetical protein
MRGARMGAISARQAITGWSTRRRARVRLRQPAKPTLAVRRYLTCQAAATFSSTTVVGSTSTPTWSASASPACSCFAPVWPVLHGRPRHCQQFTGVLTGYSQATTGYYGVLKPRSSLGYSRAGHARPLCLGSRAAVKACNGALGTPPTAGVLVGYSQRVALLACMVNRTRPRVALICYLDVDVENALAHRRAHMGRFLETECGCSHPDHPSAHRNVCA